jgi:DivIVA domain-containing protein
MAVSFSRPDPTSPAAVADAMFGTARRGFDQHEVRDFLQTVATELARLQEREAFLERELLAAQTRHAGIPAELDDETVTRLVGEETTRILQTARESAAQIKAKAEEGAARLLREATDDAHRQREEADLEAARRRNDAVADAESELAMAKQQGREMVEEARAYRERVLGELARRRELARQQIEQLIHGRDRLLQAFERARLVAVDVVGELSPLTGPDDDVDLAPVTGPVPVVVPALLLEVDESVTMAVEVGEVDDGTEAVEEVDEFATDEPEMATDEVEPDEPVEPDDVEPDEPVEPDDVEPDEPVEPAVDEAVEPDIEPDIEKTDDEAGADAAVVALFPDRDVADVTDTTDEIDEIDDDEVTAADVDDLFARLRAGRDAGDETAVDADDGELEVAETPFERRDAVLVPLIVGSGRKLKRALADEQNEVLDTLRRREPVSALEALVPLEDEHADRYTDAVMAELQAAASAGVAALGEPAPDGIDVGPDGVLAPVRDALTAELVTPLRDRLARTIEDGGGDNEAVAKRVRALYREWKTQRIDDHLDDLLRMAYGRGAFAGVEPGTPLQWSVDPSEPACPDCEDNSLAGAVPAGDAYPTGHECAPAHAGCRCLLTRTDR